jgi:hypothetical protein
MTIQDLIAALATGGQHLGDLCWWSLAEARIDRQQLEEKWKPTGLPPELLPEPPTVEKALKVAVRECQVGLADRLIRVARDDEEAVVFGIVKEIKHDDGTLTYQQEARVSLDLIRSTLSLDTPTHDVSASIKERFEALHNTHTPDDVRRTITRTLASFSAVTLRESGGIYWVPAPHAKAVRKLQGAIESIGSSRFYLLPVHDSADANRTLGDVAKKSLEEELDELKGEVQKFLCSPPERTSTLVRRFDAFEGLRARAQLYRDILKVQVQDMDGQLDQLTASVEKLLAEKNAA